MGGWKRTGHTGFIRVYSRPKWFSPRYTIVMTRRLLMLTALLCALGFSQTRVYELRTYTCYEGKLEDLKKRFRDHTIRIFKRHGMESVGYWVPEDPEKSKTTLIYIISHASREQATKNWQEFRNDPEWKKVSAESEANGKIVQKVDFIFMDPTDFSMLK
jgi:NIPSNAP